MHMSFTTLPLLYRQRTICSTEFRSTAPAIIFILLVQLFSVAAIPTDMSQLSVQLHSTRQKQSIETNSIQRHSVDINNHLAELPNSDRTESSCCDASRRSLKRVFLSNRTITCNDGSQAGFYLRKSPNSKKWIVFLEGGWHCYDMRSCRARWLRLRHLMTSAQWPETRDVGGILSPLSEENPYWHNANHVLVPYCSSDSWSGTRDAPESRESNWRFMGALILRQVIADLIPLGLGRATGAELLLVGSSAGGLGVMLNLDRITNYLLHERNLLVTVRGVSDSGWFLDREPYTPAAVASSEAVRQGWKLWQGSLPDECTKQHNAEPWRCYFGYRLYPTLKSPLFVFQWLFDEAQMRADNVGAPVTPQQWNYIHEMGGALRSSLDNVTAVFAPSCIGHAVLSKRDWVNIKIDDISLPAALRCWEHSTRQRRKRHKKLKRATEATVLAAAARKRHENARLHHKKQRGGELSKQNTIGNDSSSSANSNNNVHPKRNRLRLTKEEREERKRRRHDRQQRRRENRNRRHRKKHLDAGLLSPERNNNLPNAEPENGTELHERKPKSRRRNNNNNNDSDTTTGGEHANPHKGKRRRKGQQQHQQQHEQQKRRHEQRRIDEEIQRQRAQERELFEQQFQKEQPVATVELEEVHEHDDTANIANSNNNKNKRRNRVPRVPEKCALRLLERCSWPQCNHSCPTLTNPLTGEEMRFLELLTSFGLDIEAVAAALGVDMHTLNNMDRTELVNLLTQQVS